MSEESLNFLVLVVVSPIFFLINPTVSITRLIVSAFGCCSFLEHVRLCYFFFLERLFNETGLRLDFVV